MGKHYQIIRNRETLQAFIDWLPNLQANEKFYVCLFARRKYCAEQIKSKDKAQLKRFLSDKTRLMNKIEQLEVKLGTYQLKDKAAPPESLALYINPNPRNLKHAAYDSIAKLSELLKKDQRPFNPHSEVLNVIQRSPGKTHFLDFDIDDKSFDFSKLASVINLDCLEVVETRGGYHLLVNVEKIAPEYHKSFYNGIKMLGVDQSGDQLLPVPGTTQGGFVPHFANYLLK